MIPGQSRHSVNNARKRRGVAAVAMVVFLIVVDLIIVGFVVGIGRDHNLTVHRMRTLEAMYAAESGVNMSIMETSGEGTPRAGLGGRWRRSWNDLPAPAA